MKNMAAWLTMCYCTMLKNIPGARAEAALMSLRRGAKDFVQDAFPLHRMTD